MALSITDLKNLTLPESLFKKEIYTTTPGYRIRHDGYNFYELVAQVISVAGGGLNHATLVNNLNGTYTFIPTTGSNILIDTRANSNPTDTTGLIPVANDTVQKDLEWLHQYVLNAQALFGVTWTIGTTNPTLGTFTGWTISDNLAIKPALQELELAVQDALHLADNGLTKITGTGTGLAQSKVQLGGSLIQNTTVTTTGYNMVFNNTTINATKLLAINTSDIEMYSQHSATHRAGIALNTNGVLQEVKFDALLAQTAYTNLTTDRFRIGINTGNVLTSSHYDLPLTDGTANQVLVTNGSGIVTWQSPAATGLIGAENGLNVVSSKVRLGGSLIVNTDISTTGFTFNIGNSTTNYLKMDNTSIEVKSGNALVSVTSDKIIIKDTHYYGTTNGTVANSYSTIGRVLYNTDATSGEFQTTPYAFPTTNGLANQYLQTNGAGQLTWATLSVPVTGANNGLTLNSGVVQMGGTLIQATVINTNGQDWKVSDPLNDTFFHATNALVEMKSKEAQLTITNGTILVKDVNYFGTGGGTGTANSYGTAGRLLQNVDAATGEAKFTPYYFPLIDGTANQILSTDGAGKLSWSNHNNEELHFQEFLTNEPIINRNGDSFCVIPTSYNGLKVSSFKWSVFTPNTGTFTISLERNGVLVPGATVNVTASAQNGDVTFTQITVATNDRLRFITTNSAGSTPSGLALVIALTY